MSAALIIGCPHHPKYHINSTLWAQNVLLNYLLKREAPSTGQNCTASLLDDPIDYRRRPFVAAVQLYSWCRQKLLLFAIGALHAGRCLCEFALFHADICIRRAVFEFAISLVLGGFLRPSCQSACKQVVGVSLNSTITYWRSLTSSAKKVWLIDGHFGLVFVMRCIKRFISIHQISWVRVKCGRVRIYIFISAPCKLVVPTMIGIRFVCVGVQLNCKIVTRTVYK